MLYILDKRKKDFIMAKGKRLTIAEKIEKFEIKLMSLEDRKKEILSQIRSVKNEIKKLKSEKNAETLDTIHRAIVKKNINPNVVLDFVNGLAKDKKNKEE